MKIGNLTFENKVFLAPMAGVTDSAFRRICVEQGCGMVTTELISAKGLYYGSENTEALLKLTKEEKTEIMKKCPDISQVTIQRTLNDLIKSGEIIKIGGGRYTSYVWNGDKN